MCSVRRPAQSQGGVCSVRRLPIRFMVGTGGMMMFILERLETYGQIVCSVRRLPIHFMVGTGGTIGMGTGGTIGMRAQAAQSWVV